MTKKKIVLISAILTCFMLSSAAIAAIAVPGPQRMMAPGWFGFDEIAPNIFAPPEMAESSRTAAVSMILSSENRVSAYFGYSINRPKIVLCPTGLCNQVFGKKATRGVAYGKRVVRLNPKGINDEIATHELAHTALKNHVGEWRTFFGAVPAWFDEGLAVLISGSNLYSKTVSPEVLRALQSRPGWRDWNPLVKTHGWRDVYGGAHIMVKEIDAAIGRKGIISILEQVGNGKTFENAMNEAGLALPRT